MHQAVVRLAADAAQRENLAVVGAADADAHVHDSEEPLTGHGMQQLKYVVQISGRNSVLPLRPVGIADEVHYARHRASDPVLQAAAVQLDAPRLANALRRTEQLALMVHADPFREVPKVALVKCLVTARHHIIDRILQHLLQRGPAADKRSAVQVAPLRMGRRRVVRSAYIVEVRKADFFAVEKEASVLLALELLEALHDFRAAAEEHDVEGVHEEHQFILGDLRAHEAPPTTGPGDPQRGQ
mmetsp:Transcript_62087/g.201290  ORF Transcript_62087/g.201290 Transcript_62087/m.201290 type:complete len:242 (-) Transcript_62087:49-774(-)